MRRSWLSSTLAGPASGTLLLLVLLLFDTPTVNAIDSIESVNSLQCQFAQKTCKWDNVNNWTWQKSDKESVQLDGPSWSGFESINQFALVANLSSSQNYQLTSPLFISSGANCFTFEYYIMVDQVIGGLSLYMLDSKRRGDEEIWFSGTLNADRWVKARVLITRPGSIQLKFVAMGQSGYIALRRFQLNPNICDSRVCDFESGTCGWASSGTPSGYSFHLGKTNDIALKVKRDHTSRSPFGHVLYAVHGNIGAKAQLQSKPMSDLNQQCFTFWFMQSGSNGYEVKVYIRHEAKGSYEQIWKSDKDKHLTDQWIRVQNTIKVDELASLIIEATRTNDLDSVVAIDDLSINPFACDAPIECSRFDQGNFCGWTEETKRNNLRWALGVGRVQDASKVTFKQLPSKVNNVLYTDFTGLSAPSSMEMVSEMVDSPKQGGACFTMRHNVYAIGNDTFELALIDLNDKRTVLWTFSEEQGLAAWHDMHVLVPNPSANVPYRLSLRVKSSHASTYVAVFKITYSTEPWTCSSSFTPPPPETTTALPTLGPLNSLDCDFESGTTCNWHQQTGVRNFVIGTGNAASNTLYMPFDDHTRRSRTGHFVVISSDNYYLPTKGVLHADNPLPNQRICLRFGYWFYSTGPSSLVLTMDNATASVNIFRAYGANEIKWRDAMFTVSPDASYNKFAFRASVQSGAIAIDDISLKAGPCNLEGTRVDCDFESGDTCIFEPIYSGTNAKWTLAKGYNIKRDFADHTTRTSSGHAFGMYLISGKREQQTKFQIQSKTMTIDQIQCIRFAYFMENVRANTTLYYEIVPDSNLFTVGNFRPWEVSGNTSGLWFTHKYSLSRLRSYRKFHIVMTVDSGGVDPGAGLVFIDDVVFDPDECTDSPLCTFENGDTCGMETILPVRSIQAFQKQLLTQTKNYTQIVTTYLSQYTDQAWHVFTPRQSPKYVQFDHTMKNDYGKYLLLTAHDNFDRGIVVTPRYEAEPSRKGVFCFSFALFKPSADGSVFEVYQGESSDTGNGLKLWDTRQATSGWQVIDIEAKLRNPDSKDIFFYLVGTIKQASTYIALDDVQMIPPNSGRFCQPVNVNPFVHPPQPPTADPRSIFTCKSGKQISVDKTCDWAKDCEQGEDELYCGSCDFADHSFCRYNVESSSDDAFFSMFKFNFSDALNQGPKTGSHGNALFVEAFGSHGESKLISPVIHQSYSPCQLTFYYNYDSYVPESQSYTYLYLELMDFNSRVVIWQSNARNMSRQTWNEVTFPLERITHPFRLIFHSYARHEVHRVYHALDQISIRSCAPPKPVSAQDCTSLFRCPNQVCILPQFVCDLQDDCGDGFDEANCDKSLITTFEFGLNRWGETPGKGWTKMRASLFSDLRVGPTYDHTTGFKYGSYLYAGAKHIANKIGPKPTQIIAEIDSPPFVSTSKGGCAIRFYMMVNSYNASVTLELLDVSNGTRTLLMNYGRYVTDRYWRFSQSITPESLTTVYKVVITATMTASSSDYVMPYVALDDISFTRDCSIVSSGPTMVTLPNHRPVTTRRPDSCPIMSCLTANSTKICLTAGQLCDFVVDCKDGSDERNCGDCDFDDGKTCGWTNGGGDNRNLWKVIQPASRAPDHLPKVDASGNANGGFEAIYSSYPGILPTYLALFSPQINGPSAPSCKIQFSYRAVGNATLIVQTQTRTSESTMLFSTSRSVLQWTSFEVAIGRKSAGFFIQLWSSSSFNMNFKNDLTAYKDVTIDNIKLVDCNPHATVKPETNTSLSCDFEQNLCGWAIVGVNQRSNWQRTGDTSREPGNDHTSLKLPVPILSGTWLTTQALVDAHQEVDYLITTVPLKAGQVNCISFWYYFMQVDLNSYFSLFISKEHVAVNNPVINSRYLAIWRTSNSETRNWNQKFVEIPEQKSDYYLVFVAQASPTTVVGLDDIEFITGACPVSNEICDFEVNNCDWTVSANWPRRTEQVNFLDHTTGTFHGHYLQAGYRSGGQTGNASMVKQLSTLPYYLNPSNDANDLKPFCLRLFYLIDSPGSSDHQSKLTFKVKSPGSRFVPSLEESIEDTLQLGQLHTWQMVTFDFKANKKEAIEVDAFVKDNSRTAILIDDVSITPGHCQTEGNCDFERDMCGWTNVRTFSSRTNMMWLRIRPSSRYIKGRLLRFDHTTNSPAGNYLVMPSQMQDRSVTRLRSPVLHRDTLNSDKVCLTLYYFAQAMLLKQSNGPPVAFKVSFIDLTNRNHVRLYNVSATGKLEWTKFSRQYDQLPKAFVIEIVAQFDRNIVSDIALDDITIVPGDCSSGNVPEVPSTTPKTGIDEKILDCNFDDAKCNWEFDKDSWSVVNAQTAKIEQPPRHDHTYKSLLGKYLLFNNNQTSGVLHYSIDSTQKFYYDQVHCLTLWYFEDGEDPFTLQFKMLPPGDLRQVKEYISAIENRQRWSLLKVDIPYEPSYNTTSMGLVINYRPTKPQSTIFAIDDIAVRPGKCAHKADYVYTFDNGIEDLDLFDVKPRNQAIGRWNNPQFQHLDGVPAVDHTTYTDKGNYFLFSNNGIYNSSSSEYVEALVMENLPLDTASTCVRFAYQMYGNVTFMVKVAPKNSNMQVLSAYRFFDNLWTFSYAKTTWTIAEFNKQVRYGHNLVLYMQKPTDKASYIAIDDLSVLSHKCQLPINCDFEEGRFCSYSPLRDATTNAYNFGLYRALTDQNKNWPGPQYDHTTRNFDGGYLYLTAYRAGKSFNQIVSKVISGARNVDPRKSYCLSLWTRLTSSDLTLQLYLSRYGNYWTDSNRTVRIATVSRQTQLDWTLLSASLDSSLLAYTQEVQLIIEGRLGPNSKGVIAIDDIVLTEGACAAKDGLFCENGVPLTQDQLCNFIKDCPSGMDELNCGNCDFESGSCGWLNVTSRREWLLTGPSETTNEYAPKFDASGNAKGHFMLLKKSSIAQIINAEMSLNYQTPSMYLKHAYKSCLMQFDYFVKTSKSYTVTVYVGGNLGDLRPIYTTSQLSVESPTGAWRRAYAHIGEHFSPFLVDVWGYLNDGLIGAIAIDNIKFVQCALPAPLGPGKKCSQGQFMCSKYRFCIRAEELCDFVNDCGDGSDEMKCALYPNRCNFEYSLDSCGITIDQSENQSTEWKLRNPSSSEPFEPKIDNTKRSQYGRYLVMEPKRSNQSANRSSSSSASFYSPMMTSQPGQSCQVRYFYYINAPPLNVPNTHLQVSIRYADELEAEKKPITWARVDMQTAMEQRWNKATTLFSSSNRPFQFVFSGILDSTLARIAVDDITYDTDCVPSLVKPRTTTPIPPTTATSTGSSIPPDSSTFSPIGRKNTKSSSAGGIVAAVVTPILLVVGIIVGYLAYRRYQKSKQTEENANVLSMRSLRQKHGD